MPPARTTQVEQLAKHAAEIALRLAALPAGDLRDNRETLDSIEQLAMRILKEVAALRSAKAALPGETRGMWPVMKPLQRQ
jgi:surfactin synthase thioesterase subunit